MELQRIFTLKDQLEAVCEMAKSVIGDLVYPGPAFLTGNAPLTEESLMDLEMGSSVVVEDCFDFAKLMIKGLQRLHFLFDKQRKSRSVVEIIDDIGDKIEINDQHQFREKGKFHTPRNDMNQTEVYVLDPPPEHPTDIHDVSYSRNTTTLQEQASTTPKNLSGNNWIDKFPVGGPYIRSVHSAYTSTAPSYRCLTSKETKKKFRGVKIKKPTMIKGNVMQGRRPKEDSAVMRAVRQKQDYDLASELSKLSGSMIVSDVQILCGICKEVKQIDANRRNYGKLNYFYRKHYSSCERRHSIKPCRVGVGTVSNQWEPPTAGKLAFKSPETCHSEGPDANAQMVKDNGDVDPSWMPDRPTFRNTEASHSERPDTSANKIDENPDMNSRWMSDMNSYNKKLDNSNCDRTSNITSESCHDSSYVTMTIEDVKPSGDRAISLGFIEVGTSATINA